MKNLRLILICILLLPLTISNAQKTFSNNAEISLITCSQGTDIYSLFGHTALRIKDTISNIDVVFNYGIFDFNTKNFVWKFTKGETYYLLGVYPFNSFLNSYINENRSVWEQKLKLKTEEKANLIHLLLNDNKPENRVYLYNFLYNNCATKVRDHLETTLSSSDYKNTNPTNTLSIREILSPYLSGSTWTDFGINIALGKPLDQPISEREKLFLPLELMHAFENKGYAIDDIFISEPRELTKSPISPMLCIVCFAVIGLISLYTLKGKTLTPLYVMLALTGSAGTILALLSFFSIHPTVYPNYNILIFQPLNIILLVALLFKKNKKRLLLIGFVYNVLCLSVIFFMNQSITKEAISILVITILFFGLALISRNHITQSIIKTNTPTV